MLLPKRIHRKVEYSYRPESCPMVFMRSPVIFNTICLNMDIEKSYRQLFVSWKWILAAYNKDINYITLIRILRFNIDKIKHISYEYINIHSLFYRYCFTVFFLFRRTCTKQNPISPVAIVLGFQNTKENITNIYGKKN